MKIDLKKILFFYILSIFTILSANNTTKNFEQGFILNASSKLEKECLKKDIEACYNAGLLYESSNYTKAAKMYEIGCENGGFASCLGVGYLYNNGIGMQKDAKQALHFLGIACDGNEAYACSILAKKYYNGEDIPKDTEKAKSYYKKACNLGYLNDCEIYEILSDN